jgi:hypothetical protein
MANIKLQDLEVGEYNSPTAPKPEPKAQKPIVNIQERINNKSDEYIGELEGMVDLYGWREKASKFDALEWFRKNNVKPVHSPKIISWFTNRLNDIKKQIEGGDKEYVKAYTDIGKTRLSNILAVLEVIIRDAETLSKGTPRKPRKKKAVSFEKLASKLNYKKIDEETNISSIDPIRIFGSLELWVYNTKTKRLAVYVAADEAGLLIKGTKIDNFSLDKSYEKTVRKPEKVLKDVVSGGKITIRNIIEGINGKSYKLNGKISKETVLIRVIK